MIRNKLQAILNEQYELSEEERYSLAIQRELDEEIETTLGQKLDYKDEEEQVIEKNPEEQLEDLVPELSQVFKGGEGKEAEGKVNVLLTVYKNKIIDGIPVEQVIHNMSRHFNMDAELQGKIETLFKELTPDKKESELVLQADEYMESLVPDLVVAFKPSSGLDDQIYRDRVKDHAMKYIRRVNGENVEINATLNEMKALFELDENLEKKVGSIFKVAKGQLDEDTLSFLKEFIGGYNIGGVANQQAFTSPRAERRYPEPESEEEQDIVPEKEPSNVDEIENPTFYSEYNNLSENISKLADEIALDLSGDSTEAYSDMQFKETLSKAATVAMKYGSQKQDKEGIVEHIIKLLEKEIKIEDNLYESLKNNLRQAYEIGESYSDEFTKHSEIYDEYKNVDVTISLKEIVDMFGSEDIEDDEIIEPEYNSEDSSDEEKEEDDDEEDSDDEY